MVEIAVAFPFLILIVIVLIDFGIVFASFLSLVNATREGAVFASMYPQLAITSPSQCLQVTGTATVSTPHDPDQSITGATCVGYQDDKPYAGGAGVTNTLSIWTEYVDRIRNDVVLPVGEPLKATQLADVDLLYIDRPIIGPTSSTCPTQRDAGCPITVTVHYFIHTFTSDMSFPIFGRFGLPNTYRIDYTMGMPIR
jgi:Flp pilus assembly protein TadG